MGSPWIYSPEHNSIYEILQQQPLKADLHPFFVYLVKTLKNYNAISLFKKTDESPTLLLEIKKKEDDERGYPTIKISQLLNIESIHEIQKKLIDKKDRLSRLEWLHY